MMLGYRVALMAGRRLPYKRELEYIESTGTQYINTGVILDSTYGIDILFAPMETSNVSEHGVFGSSASGSGSVHNVLQIHSSAGGVGLWMPSNTRVASAAITVGTIQRWQINVDNSDDIIIDGVDKGNTHPTTASACPYPVYLFARDVGGALKSGSYSKMRLYSWKVTDANGNAIQDGIPVLDLSDVPCMYDRVSGALFYNAGTGDFVAGPEIVPVEYLESTGTQWINMGIAINTSTDTITSRFMPLTGISTYECLFGASESISGVTTYCELRKLQNTRDWYMLYPNSVGGLGNTLIGTLTDSAWHDVSVSNTGCVMDGVTTSYAVSTRQFTNNQYLFARNNSGSVAFQFKGRVASYSITRSGADIRAMKPIRVGSGSTWEGAMLDTVNHRVYRNAGTGAFLYGNDVK